jgi:hypothetical protein
VFSADLPIKRTDAQLQNNATVVFAVPCHTGKSGFGPAVGLTTRSDTRLGARLPVGPAPGKLTVALDRG